MYGKSEKWLNITWNPLNLHQITTSKLPLSAISTNHKLNCMYCFALFRLVSFGLIYTSVHVCSVLYSIDIRGLKLINDPDTGRYDLLCLVSHSKDRPVTSRDTLVLWFPKAILKTKETFSKWLKQWINQVRVVRIDMPRFSFTKIRFL